MNSKKAITLLVLASMILALVPVVPVSAALSTTALVDFNVIYDEEVTISGGGVTPGATVDLYWDYVQAWDGEAGKIGSAKGKPAGTFEIDFNVPEAVVGDHYLWIKDLSTGETIKVDTNGASDQVIVDPSLELSNKNGLPGETITVYGYGFNSTTDLSYIKIWNNTHSYNTSTGMPESDSLGSWDEGFKIPATWDYGAYSITAEDATSNAAANKSFTIGASITLSKTEGPTGTVVRVTGKGFNSTIDLTKTHVTFNGTECYVKDSPIDIVSGEFALDCVIPSIGIDLGTADLQVNDGWGNAPTAEFEVTGLPGLSADPAFQVQGGMFTLTGENYTMIADKEVKVYLNGTELGTAKTKADGSFVKQLRVPAVTSGVYTLYAEMTDYNINGTKSYRVGIMLVILSIESGPTGAQVTVTATGFTEGGHWNMTVGGERPAEVTASNTVDSDGSLSQQITIPTLAVGVHTVSVYDIEADISVETEFEVTHTSKLMADPYEVPSGFNVTLSGEYFSDENVDLDLTFQIYNSSGVWDITVFNDTAADIKLLEDGTFEGIWTVGADNNLTIGSYTLNVSDGKSLYAELAFDIVDKTVSIDPRKSVFSIGDTVAFDIESSFPLVDSYIKIWDPTGNLYWQTNEFGTTVWVSLTLTKIVPFYSQTAGGNPMLLLDDAPLGEYTWKWYDKDDEVVDEGAFTVQQAAADIIGEQVADLNNQITDLAEQLTDVTSEFADVKSDIADVAAIAAQAVAAAQQAAEAVTSVAQTANTASQAAADAATAAEAARDAANGLTTLVYGAIGAALVAALAAIVSLMQISKRIAG